MRMRYIITASSSAGTDPDRRSTRDCGKIEKRGYGDGSFRADDEINRAEVVTIVNRPLGREADEAYVANNLRKLNTFSDINKRHWAYYAVMEAANAHTAILGDSESWSK